MDLNQKYYSVEELRRLPYRILQQLAKSMDLISNVKKSFLIDLIHAKTNKTEADVESIVQKVEKERMLYQKIGEFKSLTISSNDFVNIQALPTTYKQVNNVCYVRNVLEPLLEPLEQVSKDSKETYDQNSNSKCGCTSEEVCPFCHLLSVELDTVMKSYLEAYDQNSYLGCGCTSKEVAPFCPLMYTVAMVMKSNIENAEISVSSSDLSPSDKISEMLDDAMEIIRDDGDYMERITIDLRMQCFFCSWAGSKFEIEQHIRGTLPSNTTTGTIIICNKLTDKLLLQTDR